MITITEAIATAPCDLVPESIGGFEGIGDGGVAESRFPIDCLPGVAGDMARETARVSTCRNAPLAAAAVLGVVSAALGASLEVVSGPSRKTRGNLFLLAVAESGTGKTEISQHTTKPLDSLEAEAMAHWHEKDEPEIRAALAITAARIKTITNQAGRAKDADSREHLAKELREVEEERIKLEQRLSSRPCIRVSDITKEKLAELMQGQPGEAISSMSSEARGIVSILEGRYSHGGDGDIYCAGYSGDFVKMDRVKNTGTISVRNPCLSITWMMQQDIVRKAFTSETMTESGFLPRFITFDSCAEPQERVESLEPISESVAQEWHRLVEALVRLRSAGQPREVPVSASARQALVAYENENIRLRKPDGELAGFAPFVARWTENAWRIGVVLHAMTHGEDCPEVEFAPDTAEAAIRLMRWFSSAQMEFLTEAKRQKSRHRLDNLTRILTSNRGTCTLSRLHKNHGITDREARLLTALYPSRLSLREMQNPAGGRPSTVVSLTPDPLNPE